MKKGMIYIYSGEGHGKSPAAYGRALQTACRGEDVVIIRFLKGRGLSDSEYVRRLEPEIKIFRFEKSEENFKSLSDERKAEEIYNIKNGLNFAKKVMNTGECSLLILDEVLELLDMDILSVEELKNLLLCKPEDMDIIMTGATSKEEVYGLADEVTKIATANGQGLRK
ncbi:MAG: cob(I)yrinic acid a c-diamide adenosyltransferase [Lachnospiraceae bacterium]|nr:cob(I)yrinic acid a c-diamide adenosyltransferase [Lachnospiraceae bacterium]